MHPYGLPPDVVGLIAEICGGNVLIGRRRGGKSVVFQIRPVPQANELTAMVQRIKDAIPDIELNVDREKATIEITAIAGNSPDSE